jgi:hypothetical protein
MKTIRELSIEIMYSYSFLLPYMQIYRQDWTTKRLEFEPQLGEEFSLFHSLQTASGAQPASYLMGTRALSLGGVKWPEHEAGHSTPTSAEVKKIWVYTSVPPYIFMA